MHNIQLKIQQAQFSDAIKECRKQLSQSPNEKTEIELLYLMTIAYRYAKNTTKALAISKKLIKLAPDHARAKQEQGYIYLAENKTEKAKQAFSDAVQKNPALIASWQNLYNIFSSISYNQKTYEVKSQLDYLKNLPKQLVAVTEMLYDGKLQQAEDLCRGFLQNNKQNTDAMRLLAEIGIQLKIYDDAEFLLESCVELNPDNLQSRMQYLNLLIKLGKFHKALKQVDYLISKKGETVKFQVAKGIILTGIGQIKDAVALFTSALKREPNRPGIQLQLGHALKAQGDIDNAVAAYQKAYQLKPGYGDAYWSLANSKTYEFTDNEIVEMHGFLIDDSLSDDDKYHLNFTLGKAYEDKKRYDDSFKHYQQGNATKKQLNDYSADLTEYQIEQQIKHCTHELFKVRGNLGHNAPDPIFIVGLPRSGSTLLEQILASHSQVDGTMELHNILSLAMKLRGRSNTIKAGIDAQYPKNLNEIDKSFFARFGEKFIQQTQIHRDKAPLFIDKMPNNFMHIGLIRLILPNAKIIDARRSPMACCFSGFKQLFAEGQDFTYGLNEIGRYYNSYIKLMNHWDEVLPNYVLKVQHEDVVDDLETQVHRILDFCGLDFEQSCIEFYKTKRNIKTPSSQQVRQPIFKTAVEHWRHFESHLEPLKEVLKF